MRLPAHSPSSARKVGRPLSALMPAPVSTKTLSPLPTDMNLFCSIMNISRTPLWLQQDFAGRLARFHVGLRLAGFLQGIDVLGAKLEFAACSPTQHFACALLQFRTRGNV